jgi:hypothetical protein
MISVVVVDTAVVVVLIVVVMVAMEGSGLELPMQNGLESLK